MPTIYPGVFSALRAAYNATGAQATAKLYLYFVPAKDPDTQKFPAPPYAVLTDAGRTEVETFELSALVTQKATLTVYGHEIEQVEGLVAIARWAGRPPAERGGLDHADIAVAGHEVLGVWCMNFRTGEEPSRDGEAKRVCTLAFDVEVGLARDGY